MIQRVNLHRGCWPLLLLLFGLCLTFFPVFSITAAAHVPQQILSKTPFTASPDEILARARTWTSIGVTYSKVKPYYPNNQTGYRSDCSGFVTMAWGLSNKPDGGLDTTGLATVSHQISKEELQPGDILLNTQADAHAVLFGGWIDANGNITKTVTDRYDALEENGDFQDGYGKAVEHTIPYPYYSAYYPENYVPMRLNSLSNPPVLIPTPVPPTQPPALTAIPGIEPFVGTWWTAQGAVTLTINADGSATYQSQSNGVKAQIQFTSVQGIRAYGTVVSGTTIPAWGPDPSPQNDIPVGGYIYIILVDAHTLLVSNGQTLCPNTEQCAS